MKVMPGQLSCQERRSERGWERVEGIEGREKRQQVNNEKGYLEAD